MDLARYNKLWVALGAGLGVLATNWSDGHMTASEWVAMAIAFVGALGVYAAPNKETP